MTIRVGRFARRTLIALSISAVGAALALWWSGRIEFAYLRDSAGGDDRVRVRVITASETNGDPRSASSPGADASRSATGSRFVALPAGAGAASASANGGSSMAPAGTPLEGESSDSSRAIASGSPGSNTATSPIVNLVASTSNGRAPHVMGVVRLSGTPPEMKAIDHWSDPSCVMNPGMREETVLAQDGLLQNVVVHTAAPTLSVLDKRTGKVTQRTHAASFRGEAFTLKQDGCRLSPHVTIAQPGDQIRFVNEDGTDMELEWRRRDGQVVRRIELKPGSRAQTVALDEEGVVELTSELHPWIRGWIYVTSDEAMITSSEGTFSLRRWNEGPVRAWHEYYGEKEQTLDKADVDAYVEFTFAADDARARTASK